MGRLVKNKKFVVYMIEDSYHKNGFGVIDKLKDESFIKEITDEIKKGDVDK